MNENVITWNFANWVSIVLMALLGFLALGALVSFVKKSRSGSDSGNDAQQTPQGGY
ncbi:MAG TPA: hypothetical protein VFM46_12455 [Pseudomonadales bacterium]|nr:hypothetical protein [Pseudomonadales bacterium]